MRGRPIGLMGWVLLGCSVTAYAGGPMLIGSPTFGVDGQPFVWDNTGPVQYRTDSGTLGILDNAASDLHVQQAFGQWTQVPTASLSTVRVGTILGVPGGHVSSVADFSSVVGSCGNGDQTAIIYDANGSLMSQLIGDSSVIGFTSICKLSSNGHIQSALSLFTGGAGLSVAQLDHVMVHEFGHLFGLDHSDNGQNPCGNTAVDSAAIPMMFFLLTPLSGLTMDDKAWISKLYPSASYNTVYGTITGQVLFSDGQSAGQGVLVAAYPTSPGSMAGVNRAVMVSSISGYRFTGNPGQPYTANYLACSPASACPHGYYGNNADGDQFGSRNPALLGWFEIPVPAGSYAIEVSSLVGAGRIGPNHPAIAPPGPDEYWNAHESASDPNFLTVNCSVAQVLDAVTVQAGSASSNINFIMNGTNPTFDLFESSSGSYWNGAGRSSQVAARAKSRVREGNE